MSSLAVILTVYRRPWALPRIAEALRAQTRKPDRLWVVFEDEDDGAALVSHDFGTPFYPVKILPEAGDNPLGFGINLVLDIESADYVAYVTDDSLPDPRKFEAMALALDDNPDWGAVYCAQDYGTVGGPEAWLAGGGSSSIREATIPMHDPYCRVDHTQVMHRRCKTRWPLDHSLRKLSDAHFFRDLVAEMGALMPVPEVLDWTRQLPDGLSSR